MISGLFKAATVVILIVSLQGCAKEQIESSEACVDITCSGYGICAVTVNGDPVCVCDAGYHADGLSCIEDALTNPCLGVTCSGYGICAVTVNGDPVCVCDEGYSAVGLTCVEDVDLCDDVTCSGHGVCLSITGEAVCDCDEGYDVVDKTHCEIGNESVLLFESGFDGIEVEDAATVRTPRILGTDMVTGYTWQADVPGSSEENLFNNMNPTTPYNSYADEYIETVVGPGGVNVSALYMECIGDDPGNGAQKTRSMYNFYDDDTSAEPYDRFLELYIKYDMKMHIDFPSSGSGWRLLMEWVSDNTLWRWGLYVSYIDTVNGGRPYFRLQQEDIAGHDGRDPRTIVQNIAVYDLEVPDMEWFTLEAYWKSDQVNGVWQIAINGDAIIEFSGETDFGENAKYSFNPFKVYGQPGHAWYTNVELWDRPPVASPLAN